jgi:type I restriction enzyme S subunit
VTQGTVIYSTVRPYLKNIAIVEHHYVPPAIASTAFAVMHPHTGVLSKYLLHYLRSQPFTEFVNSKAVGVAYPAINDANFFQGIVPLPPLAEQTRIVTRVEELMQVCDALEASGQLEAQQHAQLVGTLLGTLTQSETPEALADNWQRIATHFDVLLDRPEAVDALEQTILQLAVRGLLVPQDPTDEPASVLLQKIRTEKDHLIAQGKIKRDKPLPPITDEEKPFELPQGWEWVRLSDISDFTNGFAFPSNEFSSDATGIGIIKIGDIQNGLVTTEGMSYVSRQYAESIDDSFRVDPGAMLIAMSGATTGKLGFNRHQLSFLLNQRVGRISFRLVNQEFAYHYLTTKIAENLFISAGSAIPNLSTAQIKEIAFPLAPFDEQFRIVTRVNELRAVCAELKLRLAASQLTQSHLADALVAQ